MMQSDIPDDFVISTGETYSVKYFVEKSAKYFGFNIIWEGSGLDEVGIDKNTNKGIVKISKDFYRPAEVDLLIGDSSKIKNSLSWTPKIKIDELIDIMCKYQLKGILK